MYEHVQNIVQQFQNLQLFGTSVVPTRNEVCLLSYCGDLQMGAVFLIVLSPPVGITP